MRVVVRQGFYCTELTYLANTTLVIIKPHDSFRTYMACRYSRAFACCFKKWHEGHTRCLVIYSSFQLAAAYNLDFSPSHLSASTTCQCFRPSAISVVIWLLAISTFTRSRHLSFGLPRFRFPSTVICNIFLVASSLSRLCVCPNHLNLFSLRNSAIGYMCASFQMSTFLTWYSLVFPLAHRSMRISVVCNFLFSFFQFG